MEVTALKGSSRDVQHFANGRIWRGDAVLNQTPVDLGISFVHETEHPAFYRYRESYPRRNGSPQNCSSRAGDERSAVPVCVRTMQTAEAAIPLRGIPCRKRR